MHDSIQSSFEEQLSMSQTLAQRNLDNMFPLLMSKKSLQLIDESQHGQTQANSNQLFFFGDHSGFASSLLRD